ncbi:restriction endonuclease fold toxin 5 domain-containing protein [Xenorhabdus bovienii]|uniref:Tox-REase-5 domain-containing protein n=1 Tax=Xenorhabdus bovienii str. feltiae Moldova TaxID=1398200 RepID=A0A077NXL5_XENBV|nr:restriction endonuclease fold toxin 5 domain-containing protein [Xenorhabdus bovienii]CDH02401.1 conserved hypothetical protein [Xenorhabdus bovienii str. feltiae Moldova]
MPAPIVVGMYYVALAGFSLIGIGVATKIAIKGSKKSGNTNYDVTEDNLNYGPAKITHEDKNRIWDQYTDADFWEDDDLGSEKLDQSAAQSISQSKTESKDCEPCLAIPVTTPMYRRVARWSAITINYQVYIAKTIYDPITKTIQEFKCIGVTFDGWIPVSCLFLEAKARYDQFFRDGKPKGWWRGIDSAMKQASRHQVVCQTLKGKPKVDWHFMQPISAGFFKGMFSLFTNIRVYHTPIQF